jgi:LPXTG-site transpeptidase (sortase) family protein
VIAGHSTWNGVPAAFYRLGQLKPGDRVRVAREDGRVVVFSVTKVLQVDKKAFPTEAVYGPTDHAALRLITCGGDYDAARYRYPDNIVVFARLAGVRSSTR